VAKQITQKENGMDTAIEMLVELIRTWKEWKGKAASGLDSDFVKRKFLKYDPGLLFHAVGVAVERQIITDEEAEELISLPEEIAQEEPAVDASADRIPEAVRRKARCSFCDVELSYGEGGVANVDLFPGYPAGRRRQSVGCLPCLKERGAEDGQLKLSTAAAKLWWRERQRGEDLYIKPDMLPEEVPEPDMLPEEAPELATVESLRLLFDWGPPREKVTEAATVAETVHTGGFRMRIESVMNTPGCVMVAGPVETGYVRVGARVAIVHGNEKYEGRIKDSTSLGARQAYVLDGIPGDAIRKGDILVEV
jgi:hypothetical protein